MLDKRILVERSWHSVPFITGAPASLEVRLLPSGQGRTRYELYVSGAMAPTIREVYFGYETGAGQLHLTWADGSSAQVEAELSLAASTGFRKSGAPADFDAVLALGAHLFPAGVGFPEGWPKTYWGKRREDDA